MYNYPLYYIHTASYYNPSCHPQPVKQEQNLYLPQALELVSDKLAKFEVNGNTVDQLSEKSWIVEFADFTDPITINISFDLDTFKRNYNHYFWRLTRDNDKNNCNAIKDILLTDKFCIDLNILINTGKTVNTKILTTNSVNSLIIEDEFDEVGITTLTLGDILFNLITTDCLITNITNKNSLKIIELVNCYYQPKQLINLLNEYYLEPNVLLSTKNSRYLITTEEEEYELLLEAYNSVLGCCRKVSYINLQYAHVEYVNLFI